MIKICKVVCFLLVFALLFTWMDNRFYNHESAWDATDDWSGQQFDIVFMGDSHIFCSVNPVMINDALGINTVVLGSSAQPMKVTYYNLKTLLSKTLPGAIVIGENMLTSSVDQIYVEGKIGFLYGSLDGIRSPVQRADAVLNIIPYDHWLEAYSQMFRPSDTWKRLSNWNSGFKPYGVLGYQPRERITEDSVDIQAIENQYRDTAGTRQNQDPVDLTYMRKILDLAQKKGIPVYIISCPMSSFRVKNSNIMYDLNQLAKEYSVVRAVQDYNLELSDIGLTREDYYDSGHLNSLGAAKFTEYLIRDIGKWIGREADFSRIGWLRGEHVEALSDGLYRYTVDLYGGCRIRFTARDGSKKVIASTKYSHTNFIDLPALGKDCSLSYELKAERADSFTHTYPQKLNFILRPAG